MATFRIIRPLKDLVDLVLDTSVSANIWFDKIDHRFSSLDPMPFFRIRDESECTNAAVSEVLDSLFDLLGINFDTPKETKYFLRRYSESDSYQLTPRRRERVPVDHPFTPRRRELVPVDHPLIDLFALKAFLDASGDTALRVNLKMYFRSAFFVSPHSDNARRFERYKSAILNLRDALKPRPFLDILFDDGSGIVERESFSEQVNLNGLKHGKILFETAFHAMGNPTSRDVVEEIVYGGNERSNSAINGVKSTLNKKLYVLKLEIDSNFRLVDFRPENKTDQSER